MDNYVLGISAFYHDSSAVLMKNGEILAAVQEERFTRKKFENSFPENAIEYCLKEAKIDINQVHAIGFYEDPHIKFDRVYNTHLNFQKGFFKCLNKLKKWAQTTELLSSLRF